MSFIVDCKSQNIPYNYRDSISTAFFNDIGNYPILTVAEERELIRIVNGHNRLAAERAREKLVNSNQRFVISVAKKYTNGTNFMDLVSEGNLGLMEAIENFNPKKDIRFLTYAIHWIRKYIREYIMYKERVVKPRNGNKIYTYVSKVKNKFFAENGRYPYPEEIKDILENKYNVLVSCKDDVADYTIRSVDEMLTTLDSTSSFMAIPDFNLLTSSNEIDNKHEIDYIKSRVMTMIDSLKERERYVIKHFYGIDCISEELEDIALRIGLTKERTRQILKKSIGKLTNKYKENTNSIYGETNINIDKGASGTSQVDEVPED